MRETEGMWNSYNEAKKISNEEALAGLTGDQISRYEELLDVLLEFHSAIVARGLWPLPAVTNEEERASL